MTFHIASDDSLGYASSDALILSVDQTDIDSSNDFATETTTAVFPTAWGNGRFVCHHTPLS